MAYFPDFSPYQYLHQLNPSLVNVGWLDNIHPFNKGGVAPHLLEKIKALAAKPVQLTRGFHICELCPKSITTIPVDKDDPRFALAGSDREGNRIFMPHEFRGNGEIHVSVRNLFGPADSKPNSSLPPTKIGAQPGLVFVKKTIFAAPVLIAHYIEVHGYLPPKEFLDAVEAHRIDPQPPTAPPAAPS